MVIIDGNKSRVELDSGTSVPIQSDGGVLPVYGAIIHNTEANSVEPEPSAETSL